jgi:hypothetical protein
MNPFLTTSAGFTLLSLLLTAVFFHTTAVAEIGEFDTAWSDDGKERLVDPENPAGTVDVQALYPKQGGGVLVLGTTYSPSTQTRRLHAFRFGSQGAPAGTTNLGQIPNQGETFAGQDVEGRAYGDLPDGGGFSSGNYFRLTSSGDWDPGFGVAGKVRYTQNLGPLVMSNKGTFFAGNYRLLPTFFVDPSFGNNGQGPGGLGGGSILELSDSRLLGFRPYTTGSDLTQTFTVRSVLPTGQVDTAFNPSQGLGFLNIQWPLGNESQRAIVLKATSEQNGSATLWFYKGGRIERIVLQRDGTFVTTGISPVLFDPATNKAVMVFPSKSGRIYLILQKSGGLMVLKPDFSVDTQVGNNGLVTCDVGPPASQNDADWLWHLIPPATAGIGGLPNFFAVRPDRNIAKYQGETDTDQDGVPDRDESADGTLVSAFATGTRPDSADSDGDGLADGLEVYEQQSNPNSADSDGDGFNDGFEVSEGYSPIDAASKPAALLQAYPAIELVLFTQIGKSYRIQYSDGLDVWHDTPETITGTGGRIDRLFQQTTTGPRRFWRAVEVVNPPN